MSRPVIARLEDIIRSADLAAGHAPGMDADALQISDRHRDAALFRLAVIGEAVSHLPPEVQALEPEIPWIRIKDMRHHIVHAYWQIDLIIIAQTLESKLDPLKAAAQRLKKFLEATET